MSEPRVVRYEDDGTPVVLLGDYEFHHTAHGITKYRHRHSQTGYWARVPLTRSDPNMLRAVALAMDAPRREVQT